MTVLQYINRPAPLTAPPAVALLGNEPAGAGLNFAADQHWICDPGNPANNRLGTLADLIAAGAAAFSRNTAASNWGRLGVLETVATNVPRISCDPLSLVASTATIQFRRGVRAVTVSAGYTYAAGSYIALTDTGTPSRWMRGKVISHVGALLVVDIYWVSPGATGTASAWTIVKSLGYLPEPSRTNLATNSEKFSLALGIASVSKNQSAPDGTNNATLVIEDTTGSEHYVDDVAVAVTAGQIYTWSVLVRAAPSASFLYLRTATAAVAVSVFNPVTGAWVGASSGAVNARGFDVLPGGWYRVWMTVTIATTGTLIARVQLHNGISPVYTGDGVSGLIVFGRQLELGAYPTSYIATAGSQVSRSADVLTVALSKLPWNAAEGTMIVAAYPNSDNVNTGFNLAQLWGDSSNRFLWRNSTAGLAGLQSLMVSAGINYTSSLNGLTSSRFKAAIAWAANDLQVVGNGVAGNHNTAVIIPAGLTRLDIGSVSGSDQWAATIESLVYIPRRLTDAEMIARTTA